MTTLLEHQAELKFELGGPAYRLMQRVGLIRGDGPSIMRRTIGFLLIAWVPMLLLAWFEGKALGPTPRDSFLLDFATYARFFLAVPLVFLAEVVAGPRLRGAGLHFVEGGFVRPADLPTVEAAILRAARRREALLPELIMVVVALIGSWNLSMEGMTTVTAVAATWRQEGAGLSLAGFWYYWVAVPLVQFFMYRWLWRLIIWGLFLRDLTRLDLALVPTHPDRAGGLGFLGGAHVALSIFPVAFSCVLSATVGFQVYFEAAPIQSFQTLFVVYLILMELICLGPMLLFAPMLARSRREGLRDYSLLVDGYNRDFHRKWITGEIPADELLLGSGDIQSLADLGNSFTVIREMKPFPFTRTHILQIAVMASLPGLPLIFLVMPVGELLNLLAGALL